jgi:hypothetical protein
MAETGRDAAFRVRQITEQELIDAGELDALGEPEFHVRVSPVASGWWTREELAALHARLGELLATPVARQEFGCAPEDAAWRRGYLGKPVHEATRPELEAAIAAMLADRAAGQLRDEQV